VLVKPQKEGNGDLSGAKETGEGRKREGRANEGLTRIEGSFEWVVSRGREGWPLRRLLPFARLQMLQIFCSRARPFVKSPRLNCIR
jgi:hypothetical protein